MQITVVLPSVSTLGSFLMSTFFFSIRLNPTARLMVTTAVRSSGIAATASATAMVKITRGFASFEKTG